MATNPYNAPRARVADQDAIGEVKFWSFSGRLGRLRYLAYGTAASVLLVIAIAAIGGIAAVLGAGMGQSAGWLSLLLIIPLYILMIVISFMLGIQRAHDFNSSGWLSLLLLVPLANLIFLFIPGTKGTNNFGPPPPPNSGGVIALAVILPIFFVVGILAAIAIPAYNGYLQRAKMQQSRNTDSPQSEPAAEDLQRQMDALQQQMQQEQHGQEQPVQGQQK
ncbi:MAG: DUF805 domain-containing protein [Gammaproteobacteria bacterium]|nr:DUF805 domain-containing protein [Gammaproteobacteria bacterium]